MKRIPAVDMQVCPTSYAFSYEADGAMALVRSLGLIQEHLFALTEATEFEGTWGELIYLNILLTSFPCVIHPFSPAVFILYSFHPSVSY